MLGMTHHFVILQGLNVEEFSSTSAYFAWVCVFLNFRKKYLLLPVPFVELTELVTMVTTRIQEKQYMRVDKKKKMGNTDGLEAYISSYIDICSNSIYLILQVCSRFHLCFLLYGFIYFNHYVIWCLFPFCHDTVLGNMNQINDQ